MICPRISLDCTKGARMWKEGPLGSWREAFDANPADVLARTLGGAWYFASLNAVSPEQLLWEMVSDAEEGDEFPERLDPVLAEWIDQRLSELDIHQRAKLEPMIRVLREKGFSKSQTAFDRAQSTGAA